MSYNIPVEMREGRDVGDGVSVLYLTQGKVAKVSPEDYERCAQYRWHYNSQYAYTNRYCKIVALHRFIAGLDTPNRSVVVDHINGDPLDCRKENLRICTQYQNLVHKTKVRKDSKSGYLGVHKNNNGERWRAGITHKRKYYYLGTFSTIEEAIAIRRAAELKYFGAFAPTIHQEDSNHESN